jgi:SAM-dependent methyltransferase
MPKPSEKKILEIGCGNKKLFPHSIGLDRVKLPTVDKVHDLDVFPYPFADGSFDEIHAYMVLEHVGDFLRTMEEIHRILKPGGKLHASVPYYLSTGAYSDPTHKTFFTEETFDFFTDGHELNYYTPTRFSIEKKDLFAGSNFLGKLRQNFPGRNFLKYLIFNFFSEIRVVLVRQ